MENYTFRPSPGQDLFDAIESFVMEKHIEARYVLSSVASFTRAMIRLAGRNHDTEYNGHFGIVSITGTISIYGSHLHISISEGDGITLGCHLVGGGRVYTTAELVLDVFPDII